MPWKESDRMSLRGEFVEFASKSSSNMSLLCRRFEISRKTGYKWLSRYREGGVKALSDRSRRPLHSPHQTSKEMEERILWVRTQFPWCGRKIHGYLRNQGVQGVPSPSTITAILHRNGCISDEASSKAKEWKRFERDTPNDLWQMDFKGHFGIRTGRCHPLTVLDDHSRFCLGLKACDNERRNTVQQHLIAIFRCYGLPWQMNMDNGPPWGTERQSKYTHLSLWLIRLGIVVSFSAPGHPQTNGKDERFHRTLKAEVLQGREFRTMTETQNTFDQWRKVYNTLRPHDALSNASPSSRYAVSHRTYPETLPQIEYGPDDVIRRVDISGRLWYAGRAIRMSKAIRGRHVAVRPTIEDGVVEVFYVKQKIKTIDLRTIPKKT